MFSFERKISKKEIVRICGSLSSRGRCNSAPWRTMIHKSSQFLSADFFLLKSSFFPFISSSVTSLHRYKLWGRALVHPALNSAGNFFSLDSGFCRRASRRLVPALQPGADDLCAAWAGFCSCWGPIWMRMLPIEWLRQKESSTKGQRSWIWAKDKPGQEWKEVQGGRPQWNNSPYNGFDILYMPEDSKHCVIIYKWLPPLLQNKAAERLCRSLLLLHWAANRINEIINGKLHACLIKMSLKSTYRKLAVCTWAWTRKRLSADRLKERSCRMSCCSVWVTCITKKRSDRPSWRRKGGRVITVRSGNSFRIFQHLKPIYAFRKLNKLSGMSQKQKLNI